MTYKPTILILLIVFSTYNAYSIKKFNLYNVFKKSINQKEKNKIIYGSNAWMICNIDSSFYRNDTLEIIENRNCIDCCNIIEWTFIKKNLFVQSNNLSCQEPSQGTVDTKKYSIKLSKKRNNLIITIYNRELLINSFRYLELTVKKDRFLNQNCKNLRIIRIK